jgi:acyl-coenzyme A synthetase/AMP-(fatty) acid ligase
MATAIYSEPVRPNDGDNPVRMVTSAGMPAALWEAFEQRFKVRILEWYGAVEGGFVFKPIGEGPIGSFGNLSPGYNVRVVDADGQDCPPGMVGELLFRPLEAYTTVDYWRTATPVHTKYAMAGSTAATWCIATSRGIFSFTIARGRPYAATASLSTLMRLPVS